MSAIAEETQFNVVPRRAVRTTLLNLIYLINAVEDDDERVVQRINELLRTGAVRLTGNFRGREWELFVSQHAASDDQHLH